MKAFDNIIGYEYVKKELYQIIDMFKNKELYENMDAKLPKGIIIYGNPGMGKTMLANACIKESNVKSFEIKKNKKSEELMKEIAFIFSEAAKEKFAIILIDDIDKFSEETEDNMDDELFVAIQSAIDSVKDNNVLVIATANNIMKLPDSLKRNGRFDVRIILRKPSREDAHKIIEFYLKDKKVDPNLNYDDVSKMINYTSCADLETILNESAIYATFQRKEYIEIDDIIKAYLRDKCDDFDGDYMCSDEEIEMSSLHEAGHAVVAEVLNEGSVGFVCIHRPGGNNFDGITQLSKEINSRPKLILLALGGKAAIELFNEGRCASGCKRDLITASNLIKDGMYNSGTYGLGLIKPLYPGEKSSEFLNYQKEAVVQAELERNMFIVKEILIKNKEFLMKLRDELKAKHVLLYSDIQRIKNTIQINTVSCI